MKDFIAEETSITELRLVVKHIIVPNWNRLVNTTNYGGVVMLDNPNPNTAWYKRSVFLNNSERVLNVSGEKSKTLQVPILSREKYDEQLQVLCNYARSKLPRFDALYKKFKIEQKTASKKSAYTASRKSQLQRDTPLFTKGIQCDVARAVLIGALQEAVTKAGLAIRVDYIYHRYETLCADFNTTASDELQKIALGKDLQKITGTDLFNHLLALGISRESLLTILRTDRNAHCRRLAALIDADITATVDTDKKVRIAAQQKLQEDGNGS